MKFLQMIQAFKDLLAIASGIIALYISLQKLKSPKKNKRTASHHKSRSKH